MGPNAWEWIWGVFCASSLLISAEVLDPLGITIVLPCGSALAGTLPGASDTRVVLAILSVLPHVLGADVGWVALIVSALAVGIGVTPLPNLCGLSQSPVSS